MFLSIHYKPIQYFLSLDVYEIVMFIFAHIRFPYEHNMGFARAHTYKIHIVCGTLR